MPGIPQINELHPLYHDFKEVYKLSNQSISAICDIHPTSVSFALHNRRNTPGVEKKPCKLHKILKETFPLDSKQKVGD